MRVRLASWGGCDRRITLSWHSTWCSPSCELQQAGRRARVLPSLSPESVGWRNIRWHPACFKEHTLFQTEFGLHQFPAKFENLLHARNAKIGSSSCAENEEAYLGPVHLGLPSLEAAPGPFPVEGFWENFSSIPEGYTEKI